jgi:hypothetical protein
MPSLTIPIGPDGPILDVRIGLSGPRCAALIAARKKPVSPVAVRALVDTGASCTCIDPTVVSALGLTPTGKTLLHSASTGAAPASVNQFDVALFFIVGSGTSHSMQITLPVIETDLSSSHTFRALLGRDVLNLTTMIYNGPALTLSLNF